MDGIVTLLFIKVEGQNLADWGILICTFQKTCIFKIEVFYDVIYDVIIGVYQKGIVTLPFLMEEAQNFLSCIILMCFLRIRH